VLKEVSQTLLVVILLYCTYVVVDVEARLALRLLVVANEIGHAIVKHTYTYFGIQRQLLWLLSTYTGNTKDECYE
jgi:hypothetical protein